MDFVLTADLDWASEDCIEGFLAIAAWFAVVPTLFVTHDSAAVRKAEAEGRAELAIHPNFLPGSRHGDSVASVVDHLLRLAPSAKASRSHRYIDSGEIQTALVAAGIRSDSNICRHLQPDLAPEMLPGGLRRFPVFFEDDVHWNQGLGWDFAEFESAFLTSGLKILNFHPFFVALNIPAAAFYARHKHLIPTLTAEDAARLRFGGAGAGTYLVEMLRSMLSAGHRFVPLGVLTDRSGARLAEMA